jgi:cation diffusion facilitator CzcD-associated flavoprotein CzcO
VTKPTDVAIVGAGPYGLSIAAHLRALNVDCRIFGIPMHAWRAHMPPGMHLKSDGSSSDLSDPEGAFTLKAFCAERGYQHHATEKPVSLKCFVEYGLAFQKRFVPQLEPKLLVSLEKLPEGFRLHFGDGDIVLARRVVVAVGILHFKHLPSFLADLDPELVSHSSQYGPLGHMTARQVAVVGAGASALDLSALLHETGADVSVISRRAALEFHGAPGHRALLRRLARPTSGIGNGWRLRAFSSFPRLFYYLPEGVRHRQVSTLLGPAAGWFTKDRIVGRVPVFAGHTPLKAVAGNGHVHLDVAAADGTKLTLAFDHIIAATGYKIDLARLDFLATALQSLIRRDGGDRAPLLSDKFESSVPGLFFVGSMAMNCFGPLLRFVYGTRYTAQRLSRHIASSRLDINSISTFRPQRKSAQDIAANPDFAQ